MYFSRTMKLSLVALLAALSALVIWQAQTTRPVVSLRAVTEKLHSEPDASARGVALADVLPGFDATDADVAALLADVVHPAPIVGTTAPGPIDTPAPARPDPAELLAALRAGTPSEREQAAADLGQLGRDDHVATPALAAALVDDTVQVRLAAIESLAAIGSVDAALALQMALRDPAPRVREATVDALQEIGGATALALLEQARADPVDYVREAATEAIERLRLPTRGARP